MPRTLFVSLEVFEAFSGNGTLSCCYLRGLCPPSDFCKNDGDLLVVCGKYEPNAVTHRETEPIAMDLNAQRPGADPCFVPTCLVPVPTWHRLDKWSSWREFASNASAFAATIQKFDPELVVAVDWTGVEAARQFLTGTRGPVPLVFFNFRVFHRNSNLDDETAECKFYLEQERAAVLRATKTIALCQQDAKMLQTAAVEVQEASKHQLIVSVLNPPLTWTVEPDSKTADSDRPLVVCSNRFSPEKNVLALCAPLCRLAEDFKSWGVVPFFCGAVADEAYHRQVQDKLSGSFEMHTDASTWRDAMDGRKARDKPLCIFLSLLPSSELRAAFQCAKMNLHPALYEAYGMTIVEAAALNVPTLMNETGIGASDLLGGDCSLQIDMMDEEAIATALCAYLADDKNDRLIAVAQKAQATAAAYSASTACKKLSIFLTDALNA